MKLLCTKLITFQLITVVISENNTCGIIKSVESNYRIVGGTRAKQDEVPWQVSLTVSGKHFCGGSIISNKCILTAAHCLHRYRKYSNRVTAVAGSLVRNGANRFGTTHRVVRSIFHPKWDPKRTHSDIMVLCVRPYIQYRDSGSGEKSSIGPICLPPAKFAPNGRAKVSGFGRTSQFGQPSNRLLFIREQILSDKVCKSLYGRSRFPYDQRTMLCYGRKSGFGSGTCQGDSGGPLVVARDEQWYQTGIVSYGSICGYSPTVFTRVAAFTDWIERSCNTCN